MSRDGLLPERLSQVHPKWRTPHVVTAITGAVVAVAAAFFPVVWLIGPATVLGCLFLFLNLPAAAMIMLPAWAALGALVYFFHGRRHSHLGRGVVEVHEPEYADLEPDIPGVTDRGRP